MQPAVYGGRREVGSANSKREMRKELTARKAQKERSARATAGPGPSARDPTDKDPAVFPTIQI